MSPADAVVVVHFGFVVFVAAGGLLVLRYPRVAWVHVPAAVWGASVQFGDWVCPLTYLENALRVDASDGGFIERTLVPILYPDLLQEGVLTPAVRVGLGIALVAANIAIYGVAIRRRRALSSRRR